MLEVKEHMKERKTTEYDSRRFQHVDGPTRISLQWTRYTDRSDVRVEMFSRLFQMFST